MLHILKPYCGLELKDDDDDILAKWWTIQITFIQLSPQDCWGTSLSFFSFLVLLTGKEHVGKLALFVKKFEHSLSYICTWEMDSCVNFMWSYNRCGLYRESLDIESLRSYSNNSNHV